MESPPFYIFANTFAFYILQLAKVVARNLDLYNAGKELDFVVEMPMMWLTIHLQLSQL